MSTAAYFENALAQTWSPEAWSEVTVLVAVSGGADSVALLRGLAALKTGGRGRLIVAHFNHHLRGRAAEEDARFVKQLCVRLGLPCEIGHASTDLDETHPGEGLEAAARRARYAFLEKTAERFGARYLVTAHTADDQVETILHRILRGTGIRGLAGIARTRPLNRATTLLRPLLEFPRRTLLAYLEEIDQPFRTDLSNGDCRFTRNRIRHELLPYLKENYGHAVPNALLRLGRLADEVETVVDHLVDRLWEEAVLSTSEKEVRIAIGPLINEPVYLIRALILQAWETQGWPLRAMGFEQWDQLAQMVLNHEPTKVVFPGAVSAHRQEDRLILYRELQN